MVIGELKKGSRVIHIDLVVENKDFYFFSLFSPSVRPFDIILLKLADGQANPGAETGITFRSGAFPLY